MQVLKHTLNANIEMSIEVDVTDIKGEAGRKAKEGDIVWAVDERLGIDTKMRVVKKTVHYDINDEISHVTAVLGTLSFADKELNIDANTLNGMTPEDIADLANSMNEGSSGELPGDLPEDWLDDADVRDIVRDMDANDEIEGNASGGSDYVLPEFIEVRGVNGLPSEDAADTKELILSPNERDRMTANNPFIHMDGFDQVT